MKKRIAILSYFLVSSFYGSTQTTFLKTYGGIYTDWANTVRQTSDGGYFMLGGTVSFGIATNSIYLIKTNSNGNLLWTKTIGGLDYSFGWDAQQTSDGGFIITGTTEAFGAGVNDGILIKTNATGDTLWSKTYGEGCFDYFNSVVQTSDGGYILAGKTCFTGNPGWDLYLIKTNAIGDTLWTRVWGGGTGNNSAYSVKQTTDGGYIVAGNLAGFGTGNFDAWIIKTNSSGNIVFSKVFGGVDFDVASSVQQTTDGGYIIGGYTTSFGAGNVDFYLIKTDAAGNLTWSKTYGGPDSEYCTDAIQTTDGGYILAGWTGDVSTTVCDIYIIKTNSSGDTLWTKTYGGINNDQGYSIWQCTDGGYALGGQSASFGNNSDDIILIKIDNMGNSGCGYFNSISTTVTTPSTTETIAAITATPAITIKTSPSWLMSSGGNDSTLCLTVGIPSAEINLQSAITISPNPSSGNFTISFEGTFMKGNVEVLSIHGEKVFTENISNESKKGINLKNISSGIYFVKVFDGQKNYYKKIMIEQD